MAGGLAMYIDLSKLPGAPVEYQLTVRDLSGGVNTSKSPADIKDNQCSTMQNMLWEDGALRTRRGTIPVPVTDAQYLSGLTAGATPVAIFERVWHGCVFMAFREYKNAIPSIKLAAYSTTAHGYEILGGYAGSTSNLLETVQKGTFFLFGEALYFKYQGVYLEIRKDADNITAFPFSVKAVTPYTPVVQINTNRNGVGDLYQPENRLTPQKEIWFNADSGTEVVELPADGVQKVFNVGYSRLVLKPSGAVNGSLKSIDEVYVAARLMNEVSSLTGDGQYTVDYNHGSITFYTAPPLGTKVTVRLTLVAREYKLPLGLKNVTFVSVKVGETEYTQVSGTTVGQGQYAVVSTGTSAISPTIRFNDTLGEYGNAAVNANKIKVVYSANNDAAKKSIDQCYIAAGFGATGIENNCVVMAGYPAQKNAIFWSGNDGSGANPGYFPVTNYNLVGEYSDPVTAFGRQQNRLVIFQENRVSAATFGLTSIDGREEISITTRNINDSIGCDVPGTVQLIENNLVWLNRRFGVMYLKDSTYAYETLIAPISGNINNELLGFINNPSAEIRASSFDDGGRYWITVSNGLDSMCYVWDYSVRGYTADTEKLAWFPQFGFDAIGWAHDGVDVYGLYPTNLSENTETRSHLFTFRGKDDNVFFDVAGYSPPRFARTKAFTFGSFDVYKNVTKLIVSMDAQKRSVAKLVYYTDYEKREDLTPLDNAMETSLPDGFNKIALRVRRPKCRHIHHFAVEFLCDGGGDGEANAYGANIRTIQIFYTAAGRTKAGIRM